MAFGRTKEGSAQRVAQGPRDEYDKALDWEASRILLTERSEKRAWRWAGIAMGLLVLSWVAIVLMMPLKQTVPYVIRVNNATGVPDIVTTMNSKGVAFDDVMDKYWVARYIRTREVYDWYSLQQDYDTVGMLSSPVVGKEYAQQYAGERGLDKVYGATTRRLVEVLSVVPSGNGSATVRFSTKTGPVDGASPPKIEGWVATVSYAYRNPSVMPESFRLTNPFGFQVMSYRVDPEAISGASMMPAPASPAGASP